MGFLWKLMNRDVSLDEPEVARIFYLVTLDAETVADGMRRIDVEGVSDDQMTTGWVAANGDVWRNWLR